MLSLLIRRGPLLAAAMLAAGCGGTSLIVPTGHAMTAAHHPATPAHGAQGHDVGDVSCLAPLPAGGSFGVIGATAGKPFFASSCLAVEYTWASELPDKPEYYVNLADPGHKSSHWGHGGPKSCHKKAKYDAGCAYDYGYETAASAWRSVKATPSDGRGRWWLDVEVDNSWGSSTAGITANISDIRGALKYLRHKPHTALGIYTETTWWDTITDGTTSFSGVPVWGGGANSKGHARDNCRHHSITGGPALLAQWIVGSVDHDLAC